MQKLLKLFTLSLLLISSSYGSEIKIGFTKSNGLILRSENCQILQEQLDAICEWKDVLNQSHEKDSRSCVKESNGYRVVVNKCLPNFVKKYHRKVLVNDGANCWGTALSFKNISSKPRFVWSKEMQYWLESPLCQKLQDKSEMQSGDIINTYGPEYIFEENDYTKGDKLWDVLYPNTRIEIKKQGYSGFHHHLHSETYLSSKLSFGKDSPNRDDRFDFHHLREVYGRPRDLDCQENQSLEANLRVSPNSPRDIRGEKCGYFSNVYRCEDFNSFFQMENLTESERKVLTEIHALFIYQELLFNLVTTKTFKLSQMEIENLKMIVEKTRKETLDKLSLKNEKKMEMLLVWKYFTGESIQKALELAGITPATERL